MFFRGYGTTCLPEVEALLLKLAIDTVFDNDSNDLCGSWLPINLTFSMLFCRRWTQCLPREIKSLLANGLLDAVRLAT